MEIITDEDDRIVVQQSRFSREWLHIGVISPDGEGVTATVSVEEACRIMGTLARFVAEAAAAGVRS